MVPDLTVKSLNQPFNIPLTKLSVNLQQQHPTNLKLKFSIQIPNLIIHFQRKESTMRSHKLICWLTEMIKTNRA